MTRDQSDTEQIIESIVYSVFSTVPNLVTPILDKGKNNQVFKIRIGSEDKILRLHGSSDQALLYEKEQWCADIASKAGILTPEIQNTGLHNGWSYSFQEFIESAPEKSIGIDTIWKTLGEYANKMHQIDAPHLQINYQKQLNCFANFFANKIDHLFTQDRYNKIDGRLRETEGWRFTPKLSHGNLHPTNTVVDVSSNIWLIDWETATGNIAPCADLSEIFTWNNGKENIDLFCQGYGISRKELDSMMRNIQTLVLFRLLQVMQRKISRSEGHSWQQDVFISEMITLFCSIDDFQQDILFTKNI